MHYAHEIINSITMTEYFKIHSNKGEFPQVELCVREKTDAMPVLI